MPEHEPKMPRSQTSAPVSHEKPRDVRDEKQVPREANAESGAVRREEEAAGGDRGLEE